MFRSRKRDNPLFKGSDYCRNFAEVLENGKQSILLFSMAIVRAEDISGEFGSVIGCESGQISHSCNAVFSSNISLLLSVPGRIICTKPPKRLILQGHSVRTFNGRVSRFGTCA